jgi:hypothetical protein
MIQLGITERKKLRDLAFTVYAYEGGQVAVLEGQHEGDKLPELVPFAVGQTVWEALAQLCVLSAAIGAAEMLNSGE